MTATTAHGFPLLTVDEAHLCGIGQRARCCAYLVVGAQGFQCGRDEPGFKAMVDRRVLLDTFSAKRTPDAAYPACQLSAGDRPADLLGGGS